MFNSEFVIMTFAIHLINWQHVHIYQLSWYDSLKETVAIIEWSVALLHRDDTDLQSVNWECSKVVMCTHLIICGFVLFPCLRVAYDFFWQEVGVFLVGVVSRYDGNDVKLASILHSWWGMYMTIFPTAPWMFCSDYDCFSHATQPRWQLLSTKIGRTDWSDREDGLVRPWGRTVRNSSADDPRAQSQLGFRISCYCC